MTTVLSVRQHTVWYKFTREYYMGNDNYEESCILINTCEAYVSQLSTQVCCIHCRVRQCYMTCEILPSSVRLLQYCCTPYGTCLLILHHVINVFNLF